MMGHKGAPFCARQGVVLFLYCGAVHSLVIRAAAARGGGRGFRPRATYFSRARKVGKSALRCPLRRALAPAGGTALIRYPLRTPRRGAALLVWWVRQDWRFGRGGGGSRLANGTGERSTVFSLAVNIRCRSACVARLASGTWWGLRCSLCSKGRRACW